MTKELLTDERLGVLLLQCTGTVRDFSETAWMNGTDRMALPAPYEISDLIVEIRTARKLINWLVDEIVAVGDLRRATYLRIMLDPKLGARRKFPDELELLSALTSETPKHTVVWDMEQSGAPSSPPYCRECSDEANDYVWPCKLPEGS